MLFFYYLINFFSINKFILNIFGIILINLYGQSSRRSNGHYEIGLCK